MGFICRRRRKHDFGSSLVRQAAALTFLPYLPPHKVIDYALLCILDLDIFLGPREDVPHLGDFILHQVLIEGEGDLQPTDECYGSHVIVAVTHQGHLALKITDIVLESLSRLHLDYEEVIIVFLQLSSGSVLVVEGLLHLFKALE